MDSRLRGNDKYGAGMMGESLVYNTAMASHTIPVSPFALVVFGASGDLAARKLLPALWRRARAGQAPMESLIIGIARAAMTDDAFRKHAEKCLYDAGAVNADDKTILHKWLAGLRYACPGDGDWSQLHHILKDAPSPRLFYLAVAPALAAPLCQKLYGEGLLDKQSRLILEKPFGTDLASAQRLNAIVRECAPERQLYRIDHYLGKETVQNLMALRFANALLEPVWNARAIEYVQITVAESGGIAGRGDYYQQTGAIRDMIHNHLLQLLCLTAMEAPAAYRADDVRDEKLKVLQSIRPFDDKSGDIITGQYDSYLQDAKVQESDTETFVAVKCHIDNWRWAGTPFYLRTGKRLTAQMSEIAVCFRRPPHSIFSAQPANNILAVRLQPHEGITLNVNIKERGPGGFRLSDAALDMSLLSQMEETPDAYERLLMDVVRGDQTLFMRGDELEAAWRWTDPLVNAAAKTKPKIYRCGGEGPAADALTKQWRKIQ